MDLFDTATRSVRSFPAPPQVSLYVCGITPYDSAHLGHAFTYHTFDLVTRRLRSLGHQVSSVRNVTDVDDDIFRVARERSLDPVQLAATEVARFDRSMDALGVLPVTSAPLASEHVPAMVSWVSRLEEEGYAYAVAGWVYFDTSRFSRYGWLSGLHRDEMVRLSRERGADPDDPRKRNPLDFVLWQPSQPGESHWPSFWGEGRPGWHIECTVLAAGQLGLPVDIHGGGDDLIYPHHESELAQAEAIDTHGLARIWMHVAMVALDGEKMSKSLGNLIFIDDLLRRTSPTAVRLLLASHHYRQGWTYLDDDLRDAEARERAVNAAMQTGGTLDPEEASALEIDLCACIDADLDTPGALRVLDAAAVAVTHRSLSPVPRDGVAGELVLSRMLNLLGATPEG